MKSLRNIIGLMFLLLGIFLFFTPDFLGLMQKWEAEKEIQLFQKQSKDARKTDALYQKGKLYNQKIFHNGQMGLVDAWSYETAPSTLQGIQGVFGTIKIPKMKVNLPLYVGASEKNLIKGAAILGQTSLPMGGENTNCVIAGHRGYQGIPYFREIERLKTNDKVIVTNPWETLTYRVEQIKIIRPGEVEEIKIQSGKEMVTLLTCHPYRTHGKYRYVVYCVRDRGKKLPKEGVTTTKDLSFESSGWDLKRERLLRYGGMACLIFTGRNIVRRKKGKKR